MSSIKFNATYFEKLTDMIRIFNDKLNKGILIDDKNDAIIYSLNISDEENPFVLIELKGIDMFRHSFLCPDCTAFVNAFGTRNHDWFLDINGRKQRLDLFEVGEKYSDNKISYNISFLFTGTKLKLKIDTDTIENLTDMLCTAEKEEEYEQCGYLRDKIIDIS